jgi:hypothetical protein
MMWAAMTLENVEMECVTWPEGLVHVNALLVACERDLAEVFLRLATVGMYAQRCESRLVILERSEGWPWLSGVMAPHGCAKAKNLCARDIWYQS